jgi:chorismate mutase / prephenate dehydratase
MPDSSKLNKIRKTIDGLDDKILSLLNQRGKAVQEIGQIKAKSGVDVFAVSREREILERLTSKNKGPFTPEAIEDIFQGIFAASRSLQRRVKVAFFGPEATFTHQVAIKHFGRNCEFIPLPSISDVFSEVERNRAEYGVVPIENSTEGMVNHTLDMFMASDLVITAEREERIHQSLLSIAGSLKGIKTVYSHPQALAQCRKWLDLHLPDVAIHEAASTADAAVKATLDPTSAAIASSLAAQIYHLKPVALNIEDSPDNATRFLVIGRNSSAPSGKDKTSIVVSVKDRVGALHDMLNVFKEAKINLTKIESRPTKKKAWQYIFFVDLIGHQSEKNVQHALDALRHQGTQLKVLGSYPYGG